MGQVVVGAEHMPFALQRAAAVRTPPVHFCPGPQGVVAGLFDDSLQVDEPVAHDVAPYLQGLVGWQDWFGVHGRQLPPRQ